MHRIAALASQPFSRLILSVLPHYSGVTCWAWINWKVTEDHAETDEMSNVMEFTLGDYSIDSPEELNIPLGGTGNITVDDVVAADWNITKAITEKIIDNQSFVENVTHVEVPSDDTQPDGSGCSTHHAEYNSTFTASVEGTTIAGGLPANDQDSLVSEICFDPLGIVAVVVDD